MPFVTATRTLAMAPLQGSRRQRILQQPLSAPYKEIFDMTPEQWFGVHRESLAGYHCRITHPVTLDQLTPLDAQDSVYGRISIYHGPVTELALDAIVNAANEVCLGGGGVDGAIHSAAGPLLQRECATHPGCPTGETVLTKGYDLPARFVLHTVGPIGEQPTLLTRCYRGLLELAARNGLHSVGLCGVSTGVYGYPLKAATRIALGEVVRCLESHPEMRMICFACFHTDAADALREAMAERAASSSPGGTTHSTL